MPKVTEHSGDAGIQTQACFICLVPKSLCLWPHHSASGSKRLITEHKDKASFYPIRLLCELGAHLSGICFPFEQMFCFSFFNFVS